MESSRLIFPRINGPIENFTKDLEVTRDLGNRASPVNQAHVKRPYDSTKKSNAEKLTEGR